jgi:hypothetical protein
MFALGQTFPDMHFNSAHALSARQKQGGVALKISATPP